MSGWTPADLDRFAAPDEVQVRSIRQSGEWSTPRTIWLVRVDDELYVRSVKGVDGGWYRSTRGRHVGEVSVTGTPAAGITWVDVDDEALQSEVDAACQAKYGLYARSIVDSTMTPAARATTMRLDPR